MKICIISSIGKQTYQGKYIEMKRQWAPFWNLAFFKDETPIDVVDYYMLKKSGIVNYNSNRHIYTNGILLANRLYDITNDIIIMNSLSDDYSVSNFDVVIISTNYVSANWIEHLKKILINCKCQGIKCIVGGIGIKKIYKGEKKLFDEISQLTNGYILISDNGLEALRIAVKNIMMPIKNKIIESEDVYDFNYKDYSLEHIDSSLHSKHTVILTQMGCVYDCAFCSYKEKNRKHIFFDIEEIKKALIELNRTNLQGLSHVRFADETFNIDNMRVTELCNFIREQNFKFHWSCFLRANNITDQLIKAISNSGCDFVSIGVESGSEILQRTMNKNINLVELKKSIVKLREAGIVVNISLLVGFLGENESTIQETMDFIIDGKPDLARINLWYPARNEKNKKIYEEYNFQYVDNTWYHNTLSEQEAISYAKKIYLMDSETVFLPPFSSIFDQWPVLASYGLSQKEILQVFRDYYFSSKKQYKGEDYETN